MSLESAVTWKVAMTKALYGEAGFFTRPAQPGTNGTAATSHSGELASGSAQFRSSANSSTLFATAMLRLVVAADEALGRPDPLEVVDIGAGGGHLLRRLSLLAPAYLGHRLKLSALELAPRPADLPDHIGWLAGAPEHSINGVVLATEWLDNIPLDIAEVDPTGVARYVLVDPATGTQTLGSALEPVDAAWARTWWNRDEPGTRIEVGRPRDEAWAAAVAMVGAGLAVTVDYGHLWYARPPLGTLAGFRAGRSTQPMPDGRCDITVHVAMDSACAAGEALARHRAVLTSQREALSALGLDGRRPPLSLASEDPAGYVRALSLASQVADLVDADGLGGHLWIVQPVNIDPSALPTGLRP
jgi:SAM-dependent MidA family methyltransferase